LAAVPLPELEVRAAALADADEALMTGDLARAAASFETLLDELGEAPPPEGLDSLAYRSALLVRAGVCHFLLGATHESDDVLGYLDRQLSLAVRAERSGDRLVELSELQEIVRYYRLRLADAAAGAALELPVTTCPHGHEVALLPCGFTGPHP
jgi:hypothetical protein